MEQVKMYPFRIGNLPFLLKMHQRAGYITVSVVNEQGATVFSSMEPLFMPIPVIDKTEEVRKLKEISELIASYTESDATPNMATLRAIQRIIDENNEDDRWEDC